MLVLTGAGTWAETTRVDDALDPGAWYFLPC